ncbi:MAG: DUF1598 domain-containing protein [Thermoguttaceae bacterium]
MLIGCRLVGRLAQGCGLAVAVLAIALDPTGRVGAQNVDTWYARGVGGIMIDPQGFLTLAAREGPAQLDKLRAEARRSLPQEMNQTAGLRKVSLAKLEQEIRDCLEQGKPLPVEIHCLAGLQQVRYVLVYPEYHDIVLVGPAEGWDVDRRGNLVGNTSGQPVILLDDFLTALRAAAAPTRTVFSCSIDPTPDGMKRLQALARRASPDPQVSAAMVEQTLGPQRISLTGVPETSHFARVMVAADYRMKRVSLALEPSPIGGLPSFLEMARATRGPGMQNVLPRWWLEPVYEPLVRDEQGLAWEIPGAKVRAMTEESFFDAHGIAHPTGQADPIAQKWADLMTQRYEELARAEPVFGQLRNCMDLAVVAALIVQEDLTGKAGNRLPILTGSGPLETAKLTPPKQVATQATAFKKGRRWMVAAGGVQINPWAIVQKTRTHQAPSAVHAQSAAGPRASWWWD